MLGVDPGPFTARQLQAAWQLLCEQRRTELQHEWYQAGTLACLLFNANRQRGGRTATVEDFVPRALRLKPTTPVPFRVRDIKRFFHGAPP